MISFASLRIFDVIFEVLTDLIPSNPIQAWTSRKCGTSRVLISWVPISFASESDLQTPNTVPCSLLFFSVNKNGRYIRIYLYICIYLYTYIHACIHTYIHTYIPTYTYIYIDSIYVAYVIYLHIYTHIHVYLHNMDSSVQGRLRSSHGLGTMTWGLHPWMPGGSMTTRLETLLDFGGLTL